VKRATSASRIARAARQLGGALGARPLDDRSQIIDRVDLNPR
jgi:hypothetical protein